MPAMRTVLFICTGNTCRSPMAEGIARHLVRDGRIDGVEPDLFVASAGVFAADGIPISPESADALERRGIEAEGVSKRLTPDMIRNADLVLGMTAAHVEAARHLAGPDCHTPIERVDADADIEDPIGQGQPAYDRVAERLDRVIPARLQEMLSPVGD
jgi:protein-tyrosine-phosphatase